MKARLVKLKNFIADNVYIIAAMLAVDFIMAFVFYFKELVPFGPNTILQMDLQHQYWPLFTELYDRLTEHKSLIYSWNTGLGGPFLGNFYNYLSSPFLVYIFIFGRKNITEAISMMIVSKASLAAGTFAYYLKKSQGSNSFITAAFGVLYSQSAWFVAFYWNIMWVDALYLLPLVVLGIERLIKDKKPLLYIFSLAFTLLTNYYMGYMVCIFSVIWFLAYCFSNYRLISDTGEHIGILGEKRTLFEKLRGSLFVNRGFTFAFSSFMAAGLVAFALIPTFVILKNCSATSDAVPKEIESYFGLGEYLITHLPAISPSVKIGTYNKVPNVYCGIITLVMIPMYFLSKEIKLRKKIINLLLLLFFYYSFSINVLDYFWHGLHFPNDFPERYSFVYIFLLLVISYEALRNMERRKWFSIIFCLTVPFILVFIGKHYKIGKFGTNTLIVSLTFAIINFIVLCIVHSRKLQKTTSMLLIFCMIIVEIIFSNTGFYDGIYNEKRTMYGLSDEYIKLEDEIKKVNNSFYRMDASSNFDCFMKPSLHDFNGTTIFSSMAYYNMTKIQGKLGEENNNKNCYAYNWQTPIYNMMHALKYIVADSSETANEYYSKGPYTDYLYAWENNYYLPISFLVDKSITSWEAHDYNPFLTQSNWLKCSSGEPNVFTVNRVKNDEQVTCDGDTYLIPSQYAKSHDINFDFEITDNKHTFIYFDTCGKLNYYSFLVNNKEYTYDEPFIIDLGIVNAGDIVRVTLPWGSYNIPEGDCECVMYCYSLEDEVLNNGFKKLQQSPLEITSFNETNIKGTVNAKKDGVMWTSIPYDKGWSVTVDGKTVETIAVQDAYLCFDMPAGEHTVELTYTQPGLKEGVCVSIVSLLLCAVYLVVLRKKKQ